METLQPADQTLEVEPESSSDNLLRRIQGDGCYVGLGCYDSVGAVWLGTQRQGLPSVRQSEAAMATALGLAVQV